MHMKKILATGFAAFAFALALVGTSSAQPIIGNVSVSDGLPPTPPNAFLPCSPGTITAGCTSVHHVNPGVILGGSGAYPSSGSATLTDWVFAAPGATLNEIVIPGFAFDITAVGAITPSAPVCNSGGCTDGLLVSISGVVTGAGFSPTAFTGTLSLTGACTIPGSVGGGVAACTSFSGTYGYSLQSNGVPFQTPEPGTLALLGIAVAGLAFVRRRKN
jgi:hypothetical protein